MNRREFVKVVTGACAGGGMILANTQQVIAKTTQSSESKVNDNIRWHDVRDWGVEGKGWEDTDRYFDRLPLRAKDIVRKPVWNLSRNSSGMSVRFESNSDTIWCRWKLSNKLLSKPHMPATGVSGVDLYARDKHGHWRWLAIGKPKQVEMEQKLVFGLTPDKHDYMLYLPLYNGVEALEIGVTAKADLQPRSPRKGKPVVFYGTSIMQGGCASRPGMCHTAILGRRLDRPTINLGFSGQGRMEAEIAKLLAELDASVYVIDCLPNMNGTTVAQRTEPLVRILRKAHAKTPIVLVEDRTLSNAFLIPSKQKYHAQNRAALRKAYDNLTSSGVKELYYVHGEHLLGDDGDATVDGSHPTDLGFMRLADAMETVLRPLV